MKVTKISQLPFKEERHLVQSRVPAYQVKALQEANVDIPELIREAFQEAYRLLQAQKATRSSK